MKKSKIIIGSTLILALAGGMLFNPFGEETKNNVSKYSPRTSDISDAPTLADEQREFYELLRANQQTGVFDRQDWLDAREAIMRYDQNNSRAASISWEEKGPDNIGGRTRAILIDVNDDDHIFAGGVSGGLFESFDAGNTWNKVDGFSENLAVSTIAQSNKSPYTIIVGTGSIRESFVGNGAYYSQDNGVTWDNVQGTSSYSAVNEVVYGPTQDMFYMTTSSGLKELSGIADPGSTTPSNASGAGVPTGDCEGMAISPNGRVIVVGELVGGTRTYVSNDYGANWQDVSGSNGGVETGGSRTEYAVSHNTRNGMYYTYATAANSKLYGVYASLSDGDDGTWSKIAPGGSSVFEPYSTGAGGQGTYDNIISVYPGNPGKAILGGIDLYNWNEAQGISPLYGQWEQKTFWFASPTSPIYAHADQHELKWDSQGNLFIGNDGGIGKSPAQYIGEVFFPANKGYNLAQFYGIGYSSHGEVIGGTQDNGTLYNDYTNAMYMEFEEVMGGDGFDCDISFLFPDVIFGSIYYGGIQRSNDRGFTFDSFFSPDLLSCGTPGSISGNGLGSFNTVGRLYENGNDLNSTDSVAFIPDSTMHPGDIAYTTGYSQQNPLSAPVTDTLTVIDTLYPSGIVVQGFDTLNAFVNPENSNDTIEISYDQFLTNIALDTMMIQDPVQSWYAIGINAGSSCEGVWFTRDALKFSNDPFWWHVNLNQSGFERPMCIEFSKDGNHMYVGTGVSLTSPSGNGSLWRISGLADLYGNEYDQGYALGDPDSLPTSVTVTKIYTGNGPVTGVDIDPNDPGHVVFTKGGFGGPNIYESTTADVTTGTGSFSSIQGDLPSNPCYDAVIDMNDPNTIIVGTEFGVYATDNGGISWTDNSVGFGKTPVYAVRQNWRTWDQGNYRPGEIYVGTHGRGMWASATYLSTPDNIAHNDPNMEFVTDLIVYPNPMNDAGNLSFELHERSNVSITIYSLAGKKVKEINPGLLGSGNHLIDLSTSDLPGGSYFVDLRAGTTRKTAKFIVTR